MMPNWSLTEWLRLSAATTAATGIDAMVHAIEAIVSNAASRIMVDLGKDAVDPRQKALLEAMVEKYGRLGRKNGKGFYDYPEKGQKTLWPGLADLQQTALDPDTIDVDELKKRLLVIQALRAGMVLAGIGTGAAIRFCQRIHATQHLRHGCPALQGHRNIIERTLHVVRRREFRVGHPKDTETLVVRNNIGRPNLIDEFR